MRLSQTLINVEGLYGSLFCFWKTIFRLTRAVDDQHVVAVCQAGICRSIIGIRVDSLLEEINTLLQAISGALVPRVTPFQVEPVRLEMLLLLDIQLQAQVFKYVTRNIFLHQQDIGEFPVIQLAPDLCDILQVNQISLNTNRVAVPVYSTSYHGANIEVACYLPWIDLFTFVVGHNAAGNDSQLGKFRQTVDETVGDLVVEIFGV